MEKLEEELDSTESKLSTTMQKLSEAEKQADESERYNRNPFIYKITVLVITKLVLFLKLDWHLQIGIMHLTSLAMR